jgi:hypothetical protein
MSVEVVQLGEHRIYLIIGNPDTGYDVHPTANPIAHYQHKYEARHAINHDELPTTSPNQTRTP